MVCLTRGVLACALATSPFIRLNSPRINSPRMQTVDLPPLPSPFETLKRLTSAEARELNKELLELALAQDPQVVFKRSLDLARAVRTVGGEAAASAVSTNVSTPVLLRRLCEELGATYVKLGQFIASSPTLFPPEYVAEFQKTLDQTPPMPWSQVKPLIEGELGKPLNKVYKSVEQTPLAAASIAQVHAATLLTGEDVVIKVQKAGVQGSLRADLDLLYANARVLQLIGVTTSELSEVVSTLRGAILEEIDFELEATRTEQFATFLERTPELVGLVTVPKVYRQASATRVLTLERLYGVPLADLESVRQYAPQPELALIVALNTWVSSVLTNEWFHADVHAGNLLVLTDGRVAFIDFGIVGNIPRKTADAMLDFVRAFPQGDMNGVGWHWSRWASQRSSRHSSLPTLRGIWERSSHQWTRWSRAQRARAVSSPQLTRRSSTARSRRSVRSPTAMAYASRGSLRFLSSRSSTLTGIRRYSLRAST